MAVRVKMCGIVTVNGTLRIEWEFGNELTGSEFNLGNIKFSLSLRVQHPRREAENSTHSGAEDENGWR